MNEMIVLHPSPEILKSSTANVAGSTDKKVITVTLMREATDNFNKNNILGHGGSATVYRGKLEDGSMVAVKRLKPQGQKSKEFMDSEIEVLSKVCHRNVISLHGYCSDDHESLLVYEYMPQGTLSQHLFKKNEGSKPLDWSRRLIIALDIAKGVHYLHNLANISMIHRDLKSSNILLSEDMRAKVADFGLVRNAPTGNSSYASRVAGTYGYLAPEYATTAKISTKIDVYSYGAILMELITGRKALDESQCDEQMHLVSWFSKIQGNKQEFGKAVDSTINITEEIEGTIESVAELACLCCLWRADDRPTMSYVVNQLSALVEYWEPVKAEDDDDDWYDIELCNRLPPAILEWQTSTGSSISLEAPASYLQARSMVAWNTI
ncbi:hypothetical protein MKW94_009560 [Papaver nudicaule]|uniref:non-specific serine/threonine protein kinase n=1 Tax=Papaver nudicaule TaxID=74823 RepID=A0AA41RLL3_PAPNU|nr:hypothetical protein [Papaver nudicaule]